MNNENNTNNAGKATKKKSPPNLAAGKRGAK